ncbi:MAG: hypothetical protein NTY09_09120 [bacterium]|nr:hypothetical protein [bacterium]
MPGKSRLSKFHLGDISELKQIGQERESKADLEDVQRWVKIAKQTRTLAGYSKSWDEVLGYFEENGVEDDDLHLWRSYRSLITQRKMGVYNDVLALTDIIAEDYYREFFDSPFLVDMLRRYAQHARPFTFLGHSEDYYYTYTHAHEHPIALVSIPRKGTTSVWNWLALPHEIGHNIFDNVIGYERELGRKIRTALSGEKFKIIGGRLPYGLRKNALMEIIWTFWLDETMADIIGTLFAGPAYVMARQEDSCDVAADIGGAHITLWDVKSMDMMKHPVCHFRVCICTEILRRIGFAGDAAELDIRWQDIHPNINEYIWFDPSAGYKELFRISRSELTRAMNIVLDVVLDRNMRVLNNQLLVELIKYSPEEHGIVLQIEHELARNHPRFPKNARPRMVLAASRYAFERDPDSADIIHENAVKGIQTLALNVKHRK